MRFILRALVKWDANCKIGGMIPPDSPRDFLYAYLNHCLDMIGELTALQHDGAEPRQLAPVRHELDRASVGLAESLANAIHAKGRWANHRCG
jgi:hypothetical protein